MDGLTLVFRLSGANSKHRGCLDHKLPGVPAASQAAGHGTYGTGRMEQRTLLHGLGYLTYLLALTMTLVFAVQEARAQENHATAPDTLKEWLYSYAPTQYFRLPNFDIERGGRNAIGLWTASIGTRTWYMRSKADTLNSFSWPFPAFQYYPADVNGDGLEDYVSNSGQVVMRQDRNKAPLPRGIVNSNRAVYPNNYPVCDVNSDGAADIIGMYRSTAAEPLCFVLFYTPQDTLWPTCDLYLPEGVPGMSENLFYAYTKGDELRIVTYLRDDLVEGFYHFGAKVTKEDRRVTLRLLGKVEDPVLYDQNGNPPWQRKKRWALNGVGLYAAPERGEVTFYASNVLQRTTFAWDLEADTMRLRGEGQWWFNWFANNQTDIDGDGIKDVILGRYDSNTVPKFWYVVVNGNPANPSTRVITVFPDFAVGHSPFAAYLGDVTGDGKPDFGVRAIGFRIYSSDKPTTVPDRSSRDTLRISPNPSSGSILRCTIPEQLGMVHEAVLVTEGGAQIPEVLGIVAQQQNHVELSLRSSPPQGRYFVVLKGREASHTLTLVIER